MTGKTMYATWRVMHGNWDRIKFGKKEIALY